MSNSAERRSHQLAYRLSRCAVFCVAMMGAGYISVANGQQAAKPKRGAEEKRVVVGDVTVRTFGTISGSLNGARVHIVGQNTTVEAPDKRSGGRVVLHADNIVLTDVRTPGKGTMEATGNMRYRLTQPLKEGERVLDGSAGSGIFRRETNQIELTGGVAASLSDPKLNGPGTLSARKVTVDISAAPYRYLLEGDGANDTLKFTPAPRVRKDKKETVNGEITVSQWTTGQFQPGVIAQFDGRQATADFKNSSGGAGGQLRAAHIQGDFEGAGSLKLARAQTDVHYRLTQPEMRKRDDGTIERAEQQVVGTCDDAVFNPIDATLTADGRVDATLTSPLRLAEPAHLMAARAVASQVTRPDGTIGVRYELTGAPNFRRLAFTPRVIEKAAAADAPKPKSPGGTSFKVGSVTLVGFAKGVFEPGQELDVKSDGNQEVLLDTVDPKALSRSHFETHHIIGAFTPEDGLTEVHTEGRVKFLVEQAAPPKRGSGGAAIEPGGPAAGSPTSPRPPHLQTLSGTAVKAIYQRGKAEQKVSLSGPFLLEVTDKEAMAKPGKLTGEAKDTIAIDLLTQEFTLTSPNSTASLEFTPIVPARLDSPPPAQGKKQRN